MARSVFHASAQVSPAYSLHSAFLWVFISPPALSAEAVLQHGLNAFPAHRGQGRQRQHSSPKGRRLRAAARAGLQSRAAAADVAGKEKSCKQPAIMNDAGTCWHTFQTQNIKEVKIEAGSKEAWFLCSLLCLWASKAWGPLSTHK